MSIIKRTCFEFGIESKDLFKPSLSNKASLARKVIIYFYYFTRDGKEIQRFLNIKSLSTVYNSVMWVRDNISINESLKEQISRIQRDIKRTRH